MKPIPTESLNLWPSERSPIAACVRWAAALSSLTGWAAYGQWAVYDGAVHSQIIASTAQEVTKMVEQINNQVQQIHALTDQLNEFKHYEELFGDPKRVVLSTVTPLVTDLRHLELGESLSAIVETAEGAAALAYNARGLYHTIGETFLTPGGKPVPRDVDAYRAFAAVNAATLNFEAVAVNTADRRKQLKAEVASTLEQLRAATTDAEVQKLSATLTGLSAALAGTEHETAEALANALVQDIENRNDEHKQVQALKEQQSAAFSEAVGNYGKTFRLLDTPTEFPK